MMKPILFFGLLCAAISYKCTAPNSKAEKEEPVPGVKAALSHISTDSSGILIDLRVCAEQKKLPPVDTIFLKRDPHFGTQKKRYLGFPLSALLQDILANNPVDTADAILHFECTDGYTPTCPLSLVFGANTPYIVVADLDASAGKKWQEGFEKFAPFYLIWTDYRPAEHQYVYPYSMVKIRIQSMQKEFKNAYPRNNPAMVPGFKLYSENCMKCHQINGVGGKMGPEFNYPKNITEYWTPKHIIAFAKNPRSYRSSSQMPAVTDLQEEDFQAIIRYLQYMAQQKKIE